MAEDEGSPPSFVEEQRLGLSLTHREHHLLGSRHYITECLCSLSIQYLTLLSLPTEEVPKSHPIFVSNMVNFSLLCPALKAPMGKENFTCEELVWKFRHLDSICLEAVRILRSFLVVWSEKYQWSIRVLRKSFNGNIKMCWMLAGLA
jgi:hypothetical protein